ncbi:dual specificity protein phosphatase 14-like [Amphiura filiformis]|uniref:dual specificity protein phosphatase 14-like n=1 Tax=Amphiura filiformis TaxID=82378 RepID=UPI003B2243EF
MAIRYSQLHHISEITDQLYLTSAYGASSPTALRAKGITCVVNATLSFQVPTPSNIKDIEYIRVPVDDAPSANLSMYFDSIADKIHNVKRARGRCLVHCYAGRSRSASLIMVYLMKYEHMTLKQAHTYVRGRRPVIRPNPGFWKQLIHYERTVKGKSTVKMVPSSIGWIPDIYKEEMKGLVW